VYPPPLLRGGGHTRRVEKGGGGGPNFCKHKTQLCTLPISNPLWFAWSQLDISATLDSVSASSEGYHLDYCWILKFLRGPRIISLLYLCGNQLIRIPYILSLFLLFLRKIFEQLNLERYWQKLLAGT
jgi:hypothetical protein